MSRIIDLVSSNQSYDTRHLVPQYSPIPQNYNVDEEVNENSQNLRKISVLTVPEDHPTMNTALVTYCVCYTVAAANE
jgi:hypothetical protein